jgi:hypothetical protein
MKKVSMVLMCLMLMFAFAGIASAAEDVSIKKAAASPVIDGAMEDMWKDANVYEIKNTVINNGLAGADDLSGKWRILWDEKNLYILSEVTDDVLVNDVAEGNENNDNTEFYVNANNDSGSSYTNSTHSLTLTWGKAEVLGWTGTFGPLNSEGMKLASSKTDKGYIVEASFPWANLNATDVAAGKNLGVDVHLNDNDGGSSRDHKTATFATEDMSWSNPSLFGSAVLSAEVAGTASAPAPVVPTAMPKTGMGGASSSGLSSITIFLVLSILTAFSAIIVFKVRKQRQN